MFNTSDDHGFSNKNLNASCDKEHHRSSSSPEDNDTFHKRFTAIKDLTENLI
ncbi:2229_t:CDS:1, partial [Cetraspora pellucida]